MEEIKVVIDISKHEWEYLNKLVENGDQLGHYERLLVNGTPLPQEPVVDKIRAEISKYGSIMVTYAITKDTKTDKGIEKLVSGVLKQAKEQVLEVIDKYKAESEE